MLHEDQGGGSTDRCLRQRPVTTTLEMPVVYRTQTVSDKVDSGSKNKTNFELSCPGIYVHSLPGYFYVAHINNLSVIKPMQKEYLRD